MPGNEEIQLTPKQQLFVKEYMVDLNGTQAAIRSGYSEKTARQIASTLLSNVNIQEAIAKEQAKRMERVEINADEVLKLLHKSATADIRDYVEWGTHEVTVYDEDGNLVYGPDGKPRTMEVPYMQLKPMEDIDGKDIAEIKMGRNGLEIKRVDPLKSRELLGRHLKLFTDKIEQEGGQNIIVNFGIPQPEEEDE